MHLVSDIFLLHGLVQRGQAPKGFFVIVRGVFRLQISTCAVKGLTVLWYGVREVPHDCTCLGVAKRVAAMHLHHDTLNATGQIGFPVLPLGSGLFGLCQIIPPAQLFEQHMVELRVSSSDVGSDGIGAIFG